MEAKRGSQLLKKLGEPKRHQQKEKTLELETSLADLRFR